MKVHHIGYLVKDMARALAAFEKLGYTVIQPTVFDEYRKVDICFIEKDGYVIELISPAAADSDVSGLIKKYHNSPYHICYSSDNFENDVREFCAEGYVQMLEPCKAPAINNKKVVF